MATVKAKDKYCGDTSPPQLPSIIVNCESKTTKLPSLTASIHHHHHHLKKRTLSSILRAEGHEVGTISHPSCTPPANTGHDGAQHLQPSKINSKTKINGLSIHNIKKIHKHHHPHHHNSKHKSKMLTKKRPESQDSVPLQKSEAQPDNPSALSTSAPTNSTDSSSIASDFSPPRNTSALTRFRTLANKVKNQIVWKQGLQRAEEHLKNYIVPGQSEEGAKTLTFNVNAFKPEVQSCEGLSERAKNILTKVSFQRTEEELKFIHRYTIRLKCFDRYAIYVRKELARVLYYESFEKDRVVIRQGDIGYNFYFILSGSVLIEMQEEDPLTGKKLNMIVGELGSGAAFGELALLHDDKRRATIVCREYTEFLKVDKPDFDEVLKMNHEREWSNRMTHLKQHPLFADWNKQNLHHAVEGSLTIEYPPNTVVLKDLAAPSEKIYFVLHGTCKVIQKVYLREDFNINNYSNVDIILDRKSLLPPISDKKNVVPNTLACSSSGNNDWSASKDKEARRLRPHIKKWWVLRILHPGDYFGLSEGKEGMSVISDRKATVMLVNKMVFRKHERGKCLVKMQAEAAHRYPSPHLALKSYVESMRWREYKKNLVLETVNKLPHQQAKNTSKTSKTLSNTVTL